MSHADEIITVDPGNSSIALPDPQVEIAIRVATMDDLTFIDALQKKHTKTLGFPSAGADGRVFKESSGAGGGGSF